MPTMELIPIHPLNVAIEHKSQKLEAHTADKLPIAVKRYGPDDPVFEAVLESAAGTGNSVLEGRRESSVVLTGALETAEISGKHRARLALAVQSEGRVVHLPRGALDWHLVDDGVETTLDLESPEMLIFPPGGDLSFVPRGIPASLLRTLAVVHGAASAVAGPPWQATVDQVFGNNPPRYDVFQGAPHYTDIPDWDNIVFHLGRYQVARNDPFSLINCYDAAAYLQILIRPAHPTRYCFMKPFGYLMLTDLIGRGQCNNPFTQLVAPQVVAQTASSRTSFGNHAFCAPSAAGIEVIADACAGPHYGDSPADYVTAAVDTVTPTPARPRAGTVADITYHRGVVNVQNLVRTGIDKVAAMTASPFAANRTAFLTAIGAPATVSTLEGRGATIPDPVSANTLADWELTDKDLVVGFPLSSRQWRFVRGADSLILTIWVANDPTDAFERFVQLGSVHQAEEPVFGRGPEGLGLASAQSELPGRSVLIWTEANWTARLETGANDVDLAVLANEMTHGVALEATRTDPPSIAGLSLSAERVTVGQPFTVVVETAGGNLIDFAFSADLATFEAQDRNELAFRARAPGTLEIAVAVTEPRSLLSAQRSVVVRIETALAAAAT